MLYFTNSYGFGDVSVSVSVGGIRKSKPVLQPGGTTYAKIIFYNNCGFDWNMNVDAIDFEYVGSKPINSFDFFHRYVHSIQLPLEYRFFNYIIEDKYKKYINIKPSPHNIGVAPAYFDLENINVITIRDGFKGEYYLQINVTKDFPNEYRGKPIEIKIKLNTSYFDHFPGTDSDPIKDYHKYNVQIPSLFIAVPFKEGVFKGKVLYTSAYASELNFQFNEKIEFKTEGIKYVSKDILEKMINISSVDNSLKDLNEFWENIKNEDSLPLKSNDSYLTSDNEYKSVSVLGLEKKFPLFPKPMEGQPDIAEFILVVKSSYTQLRPGWGCPIQYPRITFKDWSGKTKFKSFTEKYFDSRGPWIVLSYSRKLVEKIDDHLYSDTPEQNLYPDKEGYMQVQFKLQNTGNDISYKTKYEVIIQPGLKYVDHRKGINKINEKKLDNGQTILTFDLNTPINPGELKGGIIYLYYSKIIDSYENLSIEQKKNLPKELNVTQESSAIIDLTESGDNQVVENLKKSLVFQYKLKEKTSVYIDLYVSGRRKNPKVKIVPKIKYEKNITENDIKITNKKSDITQYSNSKKLEGLIDEIYDLKYEILSSDEDIPCSKEISNKEHKVIYSVYLENKNGIIAYNQIKYDQKEIGISTIEIILIILSIIFYGIAILFTWMAIKNLRLLGNQGYLEKKVQNTDLEVLLEE